MMTIKTGLELARTVGAADRARATLGAHVLGDTRKRTALAKRILAAASSEHRALYNRFYGDGTFTEGWDLLCSIAAQTPHAEEGR